MSPAETSIIIAVISTLFGGVFLKIVEWLLTRGKNKEDRAVAMRAELRQEATDLRDQINVLQTRQDSTEAEVDKWRDRYYGVLDQLLTLKNNGKAVDIPKD